MSFLAACQPAVLAAVLTTGALMNVTELSADTQSLFSLKDGDRVVFLGDSITEQGRQATGYVTLFETGIKGAGLNDVEIINAGISGHKVPDLQERLQRDVLDKQPTHVVIYIGINDVWHSQHEPSTGTPPAIFESGLKSLIAKLDAANVKTILCTPTVIGEKTNGSNEMDAMLEQFSNLSRSVAAETGTPLLDLRKAFIDRLKAVNQENAREGILTTDGVHLNVEGNRFLAGQMLSAFNANTEGSATATGPLRHVVLFQFKETVAQDEVTEIVSAFSALPKQIDSIIDFEHGTDISSENKAQGFTHCFIVTFEDAAGRDEYLPHPTHKEFVALIKGKIEKVLVIDYVAK
jgi:lysophospholipase L1-like esterase